MQYRIVAYESSTSTDRVEVYNPLFRDSWVVSAKLTQKVNAVDDLELTVDKNSWLYDHAEVLKTHVNAYSDNGNLVFRGRLIKISQKMSSSGMFQKVLSFESIIAYLMDTVAPVGEKNDALTPSQFIQKLVDNHNNQVDDDKKLYLSDRTEDFFDDIDPNKKTEYQFDYKSTWDVLKSQLLDKYSDCYLLFDYVKNPETGVYTSILMYKKTGVDHEDIPIKIGKNMKSVDVNLDPTNLVTRLVPLGNTLEEDKALMQNSTTRLRLTITESNDGKSYVQNDDLVNKFGIIYGTKTWDDVNDPQELKQKATDWIQQQSISINNWKIDTFEQETPFRIGDRYQFINNEIATTQLIKVVEKSIDLVKPSSVTLSIEQKKSTMTKFQASSNQTASEVQVLKTENNRRWRQIQILEKENEQLRRDMLVGIGSQQTVAGGPTEPVNGDWGPVIEHAARLMNVQIDAAGVNLVKAQIRLESGGNEKALGGDDGLADGRASGLLQYKPGTFNYYSLEGHKDIWKGFDQLLAFFNIPDALSQINGVTGWSPHGSPRYSKVPNQEVGEGAKRVQDDARSYLGVPYVWDGAGGARGGNPRTGMDCSSFVSQVYLDMGIHIPAYTVSMEPYGHEIPRSQVQTGDMGFYGSHGGSYHITLALDNKRMIYEPAPGQSCMEQDIDAYPPTWWIRNDDMARIVAGD